MPKPGPRSRVIAVWFNVSRKMDDAARCETCHRNAVSCRNYIPRKEDVVGCICSNETENDSRNRSIDGERELASWC
jgi:hypothetical protein